MSNIHRRTPPNTPDPINDSEENDSHSESLYSHMYNLAANSALYTISLFGCVPWSRNSTSWHNKDFSLNEYHDVRTKIRILTYNIFIRPPAPSFTHNVENDYKDQRLDEFISTHLNRFDIVCLQEMFGAFSRRRRRLCSAAKALGFHYKVTSPQCRSKGFLVDGGCVILSKFKINFHDSLVYTKGEFSDQFSAKGALHAHIQIRPNYNIHLFTTHLQACYAGTEELTSRIRQKQLSELGHFMKNSMVKSQKNRPSRPDEFDPIFLVGDFNVNSRAIDDVSYYEQNIQHNISNSQPISNDIRIPMTYDSNSVLIDSQPTCSDITNPTKNSTGSIAETNTISTASNSSSGEISSNEYESMKRILSCSIGLDPIDLPYCFNSLKHPITYAEANGDDHCGATEKCLTDQSEFAPHFEGKYVNQSLDYIFHFPTSVFSPTILDCFVDKFLLTGERTGDTTTSVYMEDHYFENLPGLYSIPSENRTETLADLRNFGLTQLSDHYGIVAEIEI